METVKILAEKALFLNPVEKVQLVEILLTSLDKPDSSIDSLWIEEAEQRYLAYKEGKLKTTTWDVIKQRYK